MAWGGTVLGQFLAFLACESSMYDGKPPSDKHSGLIREVSQKLAKLSNFQEFVLRKIHGEKKPPEFLYPFTRTGMKCDVERIMEQASTSDIAAHRLKKMRKEALDIISNVHAAYEEPNPEELVMPPYLSVRDCAKAFGQSIYTVMTRFKRDGILVKRGDRWVVSRDKLIEEFPEIYMEVRSFPRSKKKSTWKEKYEVVTRNGKNSLRKIRPTDVSGAGRASEQRGVAPEDKTPGSS